MADLTNQLQAAAGAGGEEAGYQISRSLRFNSADSAYLNRTPASAGNRKTWTWSGWVKRSALSTSQTLFGASNGGGGTGQWTQIVFDQSNNAIDFIYFAGFIAGRKITTPIYRDVSAWYHIVAVFNTTAATGEDRMQLWVNGTRITSFSTNTIIGQNTDGAVNNTFVHTLGALSYLPLTNYFNGYLADIHFVDGQALTADDFGETDATTGVWKPKEYTGTYGTNGFHLDFSDNTSTTTIGYDAAGSNNWTANNISVTAGAGNDSLVDTPTPYGTDTGAGGEVRSNYCTLNPLNKSSILTISNGSLDFVSADTANRGIVTGTMGVSSGKWYYEVLIGTERVAVGFVKEPVSLSQTVGYDATGYGYNWGGFKINNDVGVAYGATFTTNDVIGVALDLDAGEITFYKNGSSQGVAFTGLSGLFFPAMGDGSSGGGASGSVNFGQRSFSHAAPSGFKALCTQNLPTPTIADGGDYFNTVLYTGNGTTQSITGVGFQPDWVWAKSRTSATNHALYDAVRGAQQYMSSSTTGAEGTYPGVTSFDSDGFTLGSDAGSNGVQNYVAWNWNAGGSNATNTDGTITSTVRANTTAGFSIVSYTGTGANATVGHGLGSQISMLILKRRDASNNWNVRLNGYTADEYLLLDTTGAKASYSGNWGAGTFDSSVFSISAFNFCNASGGTYIAYCFSEVMGYSKVSSYTGNGSTDGPFVYCGFRPAWLMVKRTDSADYWFIVDVARSVVNVMGDLLLADSNIAEFASNHFDFTANGFKLRNTGAGLNASGGTFIFMALASNPFKYSLAR